MWLYARQPDRVLNGLNARKSEIFTEFPPKGNVKLAIPKIMLVSWLTKLIQNVFDVCFEMPSDSKNFGCVVDKFSELADTTKLLGCRHL